MKLDIGCGKRKLGNINIDLDRKCKPNIIADAHHLPFKPIKALGMRQILVIAKKVN